MEMSKIKVFVAVGFSLCVFVLLIWGLIGLSQAANSTEPSEDPAILDLSADPESITSCSVAMEILPSPRSPKQWIYPHDNSTSLEVLCDFQVDGGGWTLIQKRTRGPQNEFNRNWNEYSNGFGSLDENFWIGLENIHALTKNGDQELRIELQDFQGQKKYAKYSNFSIADSLDFYRLSIGGFSGNSTAGDSMTNSAHGSENILNGMRFGTWDKDNDFWPANCAAYYGGGWWFNGCMAANLNGPYLERQTAGHGIYWYSWKKEFFLAKAEMKIRKRKSEAESEK